MANTTGRHQQPQPQPQIVIVRHEHGCLVTALVFVLFGWIGLAAMAVWKLAGLAWRWLVVYPAQWSMAAMRASVRGSRWLTARYGWRGWAVVAGVVVVLAVLGGVVGGSGGH